ncbi:unnamed protein product [marine sediment metagenome]|uniref:Uncharacterized protein n=1 Tax=marine sediment metagenome TaxID=412755 RepID=X1B6U7_9ZZZZ
MYKKELHIIRFKMAKSRIKISQKEVEELSEKHNELRFFTVNGVLLELTGNETTEDGHLMHHVKNVITIDTFFKENNMIEGFENKEDDILNTLF